jgi:two-component system sensor histidine kinase MtrB
VGLRPGEAGLVFNRFWRADPSRQRHTGGTGLGLAISLEDARLHGGWLQASGTPGDGARFRLTLPRRHGGLITHSPLPLRVAADTPVPGAAGVTPSGRSPAGAVGSVSDEDDLHPATVPVAGAAPPTGVVAGDGPASTGPNQPSGTSATGGESPVRSTAVR